MSVLEILIAIASAIWRLREPIFILAFVCAAYLLITAAARNYNRAESDKIIIGRFSTIILVFLCIIGIIELTTKLGLVDNQYLLVLYNYRHDIYYLLFSFASGLLFIAIMILIKTRKIQNKSAT